MINRTLARDPSPVRSLVLVDEGKPVFVVSRATGFAFNKSLHIFVLPYQGILQIHR